MNRLIRAIKDLDPAAVEALIEKEPRWLTWSEPSGRNALHYLGNVNVAGDAARADASIRILDMLIERGMDIDSVHRIADEGAVFPATPLWHAYARGRNEPLYTHLLQRGADPENCMFAIAWNDDVAAAELFKRHGATIDAASGDSTPFLAAFLWRRFAVAEWFLRNGADVNHADSSGNTALFYAVKRRYDTEKIRLLLSYGADLLLKNAAGVSPRDLAERERRRHLLALFDSPARV